MPYYINSPFKGSPKLLVPSTPLYLLGSYNDRVGNTRGPVITDEGNGTTSTVVFNILEGNIPLVGALVYIEGSANASGDYNADGATILTVSTTAAGVCTITFAGSGNSVTASDTGMVVIPQPEIGETLVEGASIPCAMPYNNVVANLNQALTAVISCPSLSGSPAASATVYLQQAVKDMDSEYQDVGFDRHYFWWRNQRMPQATVDPTLGRFFRFYVDDVEGTGTIVAKLFM